MSTASAPFMRPLSLGEILDQAIRLYRNNFLKFIGILAIPYIPLIVLQTASSVLLASAMSAPVDPDDPFGLLLQPSYLAGMSGTFILGALYFFLITGVATAALTRAVADNYTGLPIGVLESYRRLGKTWVRLITALLLMGLINLAAVIWLIIPCVGWLTGPGLFIFLSIVVIPLVAPVVVLEDRGAGASLRRAWDLARTRFWWLIGFAFVLYLLSMLVITGPTFLIQWIMGIISLSDSLTFDQQFTLSTVMQSLVSMTATLIYLPLQLIAITIVYFDLRVRSEGLDLALQASQPQGGAALEALPAISSPSRSALITGREVGYFAMLSLAGVAVYVLFFSVIMGIIFAFMPTYR